jgi:hypothetical protein
MKKRTNTAVRRLLTETTRFLKALDDFGGSIDVLRDEGLDVEPDGWDVEDYLDTASGLDWHSPTTDQPCWDEWEMGEEAYSKVEAIQDACLTLLHPPVAKKKPKAKKAKRKGGKA